MTQEHPSQVRLYSTEDIYCSDCGQKAKLHRYVEEGYPGPNDIYIDYFSKCCLAPVEDWQGKPIPHNQLYRRWTDDQSYQQ